MSDIRRKAEEIMKRGDEIIAERKRRKALILRSCALGAGAAAILGIGVFANALTPPKKPAAESSSLISNTTEAVTTSAESTAQTTAKSVTTQKQSTVTTSAQTEITTSNSTSAVTVKSTSTSAATSTAQTASPSRTSAKTTAKTTESKPKTSISTTTTVAAAQTSLSRSTTTASSVTQPEETEVVQPVTTTPFVSEITTSRIFTTTAYHRTTAACITTDNQAAYTTTAVVTAPVFYHYDWIVGESFPTIEYSSEKVLVKAHYYVYEDEIDSLAAELTLEPQTNTEILPATISARVYMMKRYPNAEYVAVKFEGSVVYWVYSMNDRPKT